SFSLTHPLVIANPVGSGYIMYYTAWTSSTASSLARATSSDGISWTKTGSVLAPTAAAWDSVSVGMAARVSYDSSSGTWTLWYSGSDTATGGGWDLGLATSSDGISWTKGPSNPIMAHGDANDTNDAQGGKITEWGGMMYYYYSCHTTTYNICLANSS